MKNKMMRAASVLMVAVLLSTCAISGTFAKYVTSDTGTDTARVAKWGFKATDSSIVLDGLFDTAYAGDDGVLGKADVIAPGTTNSVGFSFVYDTANNGATAPEVAYTFDINATGEIDTELVDNTNIQWKLDNGSWGTFAALLDAINALEVNATPVDGKANNYYAPGTLPTKFYTDGNGEATHTVSWQWILNDSMDVADTQNKKDTALGNAGELNDVSITITITATQVD